MPIYSNFLRRIVFSDERVFHVSEIANTHNVRSLKTENLRAVQKHEIHIEKKTVCCAIHSESVLDPYYLKMKQSQKNSIVSY